MVDTCAVKLGEGSFAVVTEELYDSMLVAVKRNTSSCETKRTLREAKILSKIECHECIPRFFTCIVDPVRSTVAIYMQHLGSGMTLMHWLIENKHTPTTHDRRVGYVKCVSDALDHLHNVCSVAHLDLKPDNVVVQEDKAYIIDFNLAVSCKRTSQMKIKWNRGTLPYVAPEQLNLEARYRNLRSDDNCTVCVYGLDVWAFGVLVHACMFDCLPFHKASLKEIAFSKAMLMQLQSTNAFDSIRKAYSPELGHVRATDGWIEVINCTLLIDVQRRSGMKHVRALVHAACTESM